MVASYLPARDMKISFWHSMGFHVKSLIEKMADEYNRNHSGVRIEPVFQGLYEEMQVKMLASAVTGQLPDVAQVQMEYLDPYIENGVVDPLGSEIPYEMKNDIMDIMWETVTRNGKVYAVPYAISTMVFYYNGDAFQEAGIDPDSPPETWEQMVEYGKKLTGDTDGDGEIDTYAMMLWVNGMYGLAPMLWANGGSFFSEDGQTINLTSTEMVETVNLVCDLIFTHEIMPQTWSDWEAGQAFLRGKLSMGAFTSAGLAYGEQNLPWSLKVAPMPSINGNRYTVLSGSVLVNFARNKKKRRAVNDFIAWLVNKQNTARLHETVGFIPVRKSSIKSLQVKAFDMKHPNYRVPIDSLEFARPLPVHVEFFKIDNHIREMLQRIILNRSDPLQELRKTEKLINNMIQ